MKKIFANLFLLTGCMFTIGITAVMAQNATTAAGGAATGTGGTVYYSVGQVFSQSLNTSDCSAYKVLQGVEQKQGIVPAVISSWLGLTNDWFAASNWSCGVPNAASNITIPPNGGGVLFQPVIAAGVAQVHNLIINPNASVTNNGILQVSSGGIVTNQGIFTNNGTFNQ
jgi:hypothetical protein